VTAYGALLPQSALDIPVHGWVNLHFSLLPAWRGAAPVQHAVLRARRHHRRDHLPDRGRNSTRALSSARSPSRSARQTPAATSGPPRVFGAELMVRTLDAIEDGTIRAVPQPTDGVSFAPKLTPADAGWTGSFPPT